MTSDPVDGETAAALEEESIEALQERAADLRDRIEQAKGGDPADLELLETELEILRLQLELRAPEDPATGTTDQRPPEVPEATEHQAADPTDGGTTSGSDAEGTSEPSHGNGLLEGRRAYWIALGLLGIQVPLLVLAFVSVDAPDAAGWPGHLLGLAVVGLAIYGLKRLVEHTREVGGTVGLAAGALVGLPAGVWLAAIILPTLATAGTFLYFGPGFAYASAMAYVGLPLFAISTLIGFGVRRWKSPRSAWGWFAVPVAAGHAFHAIVGGWFALASTVMASTAREAYQKNTPGFELAVVLGVLVLLALLHRRR